jgi:hypothetical protein
LRDFYAGDETGPHQRHNQAMRSLLLVLVVPFLLGAESNPNRPQRAEIKRYRLELTVPEQHGIYFSAWSDPNGKLTDAILDHDGSDGKTVTFIRWFVWYDGCTWEASETITPTAADKYDYKYRERAISCPAGLTSDPNAETPRDGKVKVFPTDPNRPLTVFKAWAKGWDKQR